MLFPYLWIRDRLVVGPHELMSRQALMDDDFVSAQVKRDVEGLLKMYEMRGSMADRFGTVVRPADGKIGDGFEREEMRPLRRAVVAALLDRVPLEIGKREDAQGWHVPTSDNALLYLHQLDGSGRVAVQYGRMVELTVSGLTIGEENSRIHAPSELHAPFLGPDPDGLYLGALYRELTADTTEARRLGRAIDWLDLAWRNTTSIDDDTRIVALYNGFEVLLDEEGALELGVALATLLEPSAPKTKRSIPNRPRDRRSDIRPQRRHRPRVVVRLLCVPAARRAHLSPAVRVKRAVAAVPRRSSSSTGDRTVSRERWSSGRTARPFPARRP